ncbi:MAG: primosomal protein N' [Bacillales bacterium]|jgi:primosomal protein N' (replication factor Y)|nr:primosomal protein N' [Bacillales bacterium]
MLIAKVLIEYQTQSLDSPFSYTYTPEQNIKKGVRVLVSFRNRNIIGFVVDTYLENKSQKELENELGFSLNSIISTIDNDVVLTDELLSLADWMNNFYLEPKITCLNSMLPPTLRPMSSKLKSKPIYKKYVSLNPNFNEKLSDKQNEIIIYLNNKEDKGDFINNIDASKAVINTLIKKQALILSEERKYRSVGNIISQDKTLEKLTAEQLQAYKQIILGDKTTYLLQGITGSGKTEVYFSLIQHYLKLGKNVLFLVSEISLTSQIVSRFKANFYEETAILHSSLSNNEKYDEYCRISKGLVRVVIGARSAVFAPLNNIGLIIVDEEHSATYKQDVAPAYEAKDIVNWRAVYNKCKVILGSATPSLISKALTIKNKYDLVQLKNRYNNAFLPNILVVDMMKELRQNNYSIFSKELIKQIKIVKERNEQALLLLNQRGFAKRIQCLDCGETMHCPQCHVPLVYHQKENNVVCHYCGFSRPFDNTCPKCHNLNLIKLGIGLEKVAEIFKKVFPEMSILRMDADTTKLKNSQFEMLEDFKNHKYDVLLGTSMISKGLDFENVTLAAVLNADIGLMIDYRSSEDIFQLLTQLVGRAGRGNKKGIGIIQTTNPNHYSIICAAKQDYDLFFKTEMRERHLSNYPPYSYLVAVILKSQDQEILKVHAIHVKEQILNLDKDLVVLGPSIPFLEYKAGNFRRRLIIKTKKLDKLISDLKKLKPFFLSLKKVRINIDIDPHIDIGE